MENDKQQLKDYSFNNLVTLKEIFEEAGIKYWIDCGLLLGLYREGDVIEGDEGDIDIGIPIDDIDKLDKITKKIIRRTAGFRVKKRIRLEENNKIVGMALKRGDKDKSLNSFYALGSLVDIHVYNRRDDYVYFLMSIAGTPTHKKLGIYIHPAELFETLGEIEWRGVKFPCPKDIESYLINRYGKDWHINKIKTGEWKGPTSFKSNPCFQIWSEEKFGKLLTHKKNNEERYT